MWKPIAVCLALFLVQANLESISYKTDWWNSALFYTIYVRSFLDTDGDGVGDLNGVTAKLDYLNKVGVDAVILSPIYKTSLHDFGYDVTDYYNVHPEYGSTEDLEQLVLTASKMDIKIVLDFVPNHTSNESEWFIKSVHKEEYYTDWYIWENGHVNDAGRRSPPNNWISFFKKSAWAYSPIRDQYYLHHFAKEQADLNYRNPVVLEEIKSIMRFWLEKGIAGMRMSSINYLVESDKDMFGGRYPDEPKSGKPGAEPNDYEYLDHVHTKDHEETYEIVSQFRDVFDSISVRDNLTRVLITEASSTIKNAVRYYGDKVHYRAHIPLNLNIIEEVTKNSNAQDLKHITDRWLTYKPFKKPANWMSGNHDISRVGTRYGSGLVDAFNMLILLLPGIAITYMMIQTVIMQRSNDDEKASFDGSEGHQTKTSLKDGEELGMVNGFVPWSSTKDPLACNTDDPVNFVDVTRDPVRTPFQWNSGKNAGFSVSEHPWLPLADGYETLNQATQQASLRSHLQLYRTLAVLRRRSAFKYGRYESIAFNSEVFAFKRWFNDDSYVIVINIGKTYQVVNLTAFDLIFGQLEVEASSVMSSRTRNDNVHATALDLSGEEALVLRMQY